VEPRAELGVVHAELCAEHTLVGPDGEPVLIDIEGLMYTDIEVEHCRMQYYQYVMQSVHSPAITDQCRMSGMGLDASVGCRCWRDGVTTLPPVPRELIVEDEDGYLDLAVPDDADNSALHDAFARWHYDQACPHKRMEHTDLRISNWAGYRRFQHALSEQGWQHFPTLHAHLPQANGGLLPPQHADAALAELTLFAALGQPVDKTVLRDEDTGETLMVHIEAYQGTAIWSPKFRAGVDPQGFFVLDVTTDPPTETFRSMRFTQRVLDDGRAELTDERHTLILDRPIKSWSEGLPPAARLAVSTSPSEVEAEFGWILDALTTVLRAAISTGNPVRWY